MVSSEVRGGGLKWWMWALLGAPFLATGALTGWLVGLSSSPVVASLLPLIFGVFGALGYGLLEKRAAEQGMRDKINALDESVRGTVEAVLATRPRPMAIPVFWSVGVVLFCAACAGGVHLGMNARLPQYGAMSRWVDTAKLQPAEGALLFDLRWTLQSAGVSDAEAAELFRVVVKPVLALGDELMRYSKLTDIANQFGQADYDMGRNVAGDPEIPPPDVNFRANG